MKYALMDRHRCEFKISMMARVLHVSRTGFHQWRARDEDCGIRRRRAEFDRRVRAVCDVHRGCYGAPRIAIELREDGLPCDRKTVAQSFRRQGLRARAARKFKAATNSDHSMPVAPNLLEQDFTASGPNQNWVSDITYLSTDEGWLYLATVIDLYSRQVVGWAMDKRMKAKLVCDALNMALW